MGGGGGIPSSSGSSHRLVMYVKVKTINYIFPLVLQSRNYFDQPVPWLNKFGSGSSAEFFFLHTFLCNFEPHKLGSTDYSVVALPVKISQKTK